MPTTTPTTSPARHYQQPGWFTQHVMNRAIRRLSRMGIRPRGLRELRVQGRSTGAWRSIPVNVLETDAGRFLVAARGETQWVRNLRVAGGGELRVGRRVERFTATELHDIEAAVPVLREYLERWAWEVGEFFDGVGAKATDQELAAIVGLHPIFRLA